MKIRLTLLLYFLAVSVTQSIYSQNRAPSCWLNYQDNFEGDIIVNTILAKFPSPLYTYYCALQWNAGLEGGGYCGMQEHPNGRNFIYSLWEPIGSSDSIVATYIYPGTIVENFGGEGTGLKAWNFTIGWQTGQWYSFVTRTWNYSSHTMFGFWIYNHSDSVWYHLVTMDFPIIDIKFSSSTSSFIEDWHGNGWNVREIHQKEGWKRKTTNQSWNVFASSYFVRTYPDPGAANYINNYDGGVENNYYFMISGGNTTPSTNVSGSYLYLSNSNPSPGFETGEIISLNDSLNNNLLFLSWAIDSSKLQQFSYHIRVFDNPSFNGNALIEIDKNIPHIRSEQIDISSLQSNNQYYILFYIKDLFDNISDTITDSFGFPLYTVSASVNPENGGSINGEGDYEYGETANLIATAKAGYDFINWTENGTQVSIDTNYSFTVTGNKTLVANFEETVDVFDVDLNRLINVYPNPSTREIIIKGNNIDLIKVINNNGRIIKQVKVESYGTKIDLGNEAKGIYILELIVKDKSILKKIIIK